MPVAPAPDRTPSQAPQSLPELLRIMDVATALRHEREKASAQLDFDEMTTALRQRLRATADTMGDPVTDAEIEAAIRQYFAQLYQFKEPPRGVQRTLALLYVRRRAVIAALVAVGAVVMLVWWLFFAASGPFSPAAKKTRLATQRAQLQASMQRRVDEAWAKFTTLHTTVLGLAHEADATAEANALRRQAESAHHSGMAATIDDARVRLEALHTDLDEEYEVRIVNRAREDSGVRRDFDGKTSGYYLVVEAVTKKGDILQRLVRNAEDNDKLKRVAKWGEQVPREVYERIAADKKADGIVDENLFARKRRGQRREEVVLPRLPGGPPLTRTRQITDV